MSQPTPPTPSVNALTINAATLDLIDSFNVPSGVNIVSKPGAVIDFRLGSAYVAMTALGDVLYGGTNGIATRLAGETTTTRKFLRSVGVGGVATAPAWDTLQAGDIPALAYEPALGNPAVNGYVLSSTTLGVRSWIAAGAGSGTVTTVSCGDLSPLFTSNVANPSTTPSITFTLSTQVKNTVLAGPTTGVDAAPTFRILVAADIPALSYISTTLASANILVGNGSNIATAVALSNDASITNAGALTVTGLKGVQLAALATGFLYYSAGGGTFSWSAGSASGANPSASVGLTAVNGSAATFLRSDGAPALSVSIVPTWTGIHTFNAIPVIIKVGIMQYSTTGNAATVWIGNRTGAGNQGMMLSGTPVSNNFSVIALATGTTKMNVGFGIFTSDIDAGGTANYATAYMKGQSTSSDWVFNTAIADSDRGDIVFTPQATELLRLSKKTGNITFTGTTPSAYPVIVGSTPATLQADSALYVVGSGLNVSAAILSYGGSTGINLRQGTCGGTASSPSATGSGIRIMGIGGQGWGTAWATGAAIWVYTSEAWSGTNQGCYMQFYTTLTGAAGYAERMRISDAGNLLIGGTADTGLTGAGGLSVFSTTASSSKTTGCAIFAGGVGIAGAVYANSAVLTTALPISSGGTGLSSTSQNYAFIGPTSGSGAPSWRGLALGDLPAIDNNTVLGNISGGAAAPSALTALAGLTAYGIRDTSAAYDVQLGATSSTTLTGNRALTVDVTNAARIIKLTGNPTLADWFDQSVKTTATPQLANLGLGGAVSAAGLTIYGPNANQILIKGSDAGHIDCNLVCSGVYFLMVDSATGVKGFKIDLSTGNTTIQGGSITTGTPTGGTAAAWKFGIYVATPTVPVGYLQVDVAGTLYEIPAKVH